MDMKIIRGKRLIIVAFSAAAILFFGWVFLTCATDPVARRSFTNAFIHEPAPTPLPALPAFGTGKLPGYGEPPMPDYDSVQRDELDDLPVGDIDSLPKKKDAKEE